MTVLVQQYIYDCPILCWLTEYQGIVKKTIFSQGNDREGSFDSWITITRNEKMKSKKYNFYYLIIS